MYKDLNTAFPDIINFENPVALALGIHNKIYDFFKSKYSKIIIRLFLIFILKKSKYHNIAHRVGSKRCQLTRKVCRTIPV